MYIAWTGFVRQFKVFFYKSIISQTGLLKNSEKRKQMPINMS